MALEPRPDKDTNRSAVVFLNEQAASELHLLMVHLGYRRMTYLVRDLIHQEYVAQIEKRRKQ